MLSRFLDKLRCDAWTDPHYATADGALIDYQGVGLFVMAEYVNSGLADCEGLPDFQVLVEQDNRFGDPFTSYVKSVTLVLPGGVTIKVGQNRQLTVVSI